MNNNQNTPVKSEISHDCHYRGKVTVALPSLIRELELMRDVENDYLAVAFYDDNLVLQSAIQVAHLHDCTKENEAFRRGLYTACQKPLNQRDDIKNIFFERLQIIEFCKFLRGQGFHAVTVKADEQGVFLTSEPYYYACLGDCSF